MRKMNDPTDNSVIDLLEKNTHEYGLDGKCYIVRERYCSKYWGSCFVHDPMPIDLIIDRLVSRETTKYVINQLCRHTLKRGIYLNDLDMTVLQWANPVVVTIFVLLNKFKIYFPNQYAKFDIGFSAMISPKGYDDAIESMREATISILSDVDAPSACITYVSQAFATGMDLFLRILMKYCPLDVAFSALAYSTVNSIDITVEPVWFGLDCSIEKAVLINYIIQIG